MYMISPTNFLISYIFLYFIFLMAVFLVAVKKSDLNKLTIFIFVLLLTIVCGLRSPAVGTDTYAFYLLTKQMVQQNSFLWSKDYIYYGLTREAYSLFGYIGVVFFPALITSIMLSLSYKELVFKDYVTSYNAHRMRGLTKGFYLTLALLLLINSSDFLFQIVNQTRQVMSLSFALFGGVLLFNKRFFSAVVLFVIATFTHHSAPLVILCMMGCYFIKNTKFWFLMLAMTTVISLSGMSKPLLSLMGLTIDEDSVYYQALNSNTVLYIKTAITCSLGVICYVMTRRSAIKGTLYRYILNVYVAICSLAMLLVVYGEASNRIQRYAGVIFPVLFAMSLMRVRVNEWLVVLILLTSMLYMIFLMNYDATLITIGIYRNESLPL